MTKGLSLFAKRRRRNRTALKARAGTRPRLSVHRSGKHIYAQVIDDAQGRPLASASTLEKDVRGTSGANIAAATAVGTRVAEAAKAVGMSRQSAYALRARLDGPKFREAFEGARRMGLRARAAASRQRLHAARSRWEGPGLAALDYLRAAPSQADISGAYADMLAAQADMRAEQADMIMHEADAADP